MKRITVLFFFLLSIFFTYGQEVTIGTGTLTDKRPLSNYFGFERSAALYTAEEIGQQGFINRLAWDIGVTNIARPIKIYLKEVESATLSAASWSTFIEGATVVYDGMFTPGIVGFNTINFDSSFNYTGGTKNLLVLVEANFGGGGTTVDGSDGLKIKATEKINMHFAIHKDREIPTDNLDAITSRPNIKVTFGSQITCLSINGAIANTTATSVGFTITGRDTTESISYEVRTSGAGGSGETGLAVSGTVTDLTANPIVVEGLTQTTAYTLYVRANCGGERVSYYSLIGTFTTQQQGASLPFNENFEGAINWTLSTGAANNWFVGTAVNNGGTKSLYISENNGTTNTYNVSGGATAAHAYRDITIPEGTANISVGFDWRCMGEGTTTKFDYFRVWLVPASFTPTMGTQIVAATDRIRLGGDFNLNSDFKRENFEVNAAAFAGQNMRLVFEWRQDGSGGAQPPAAIDNITVSVLTCSAPTAIVENTTTATSATVAWTAAADQDTYEIYYATSGEMPGDTVTGSVVTTQNPYTIEGLNPSTLYTIWIRTICSETDKSVWNSGSVRTKQVAAVLPYNEDFEGDISWTTGSNTINKWVVGTAVQNGGTKSLYMTSDEGVTNSYDVDKATVAHAYRDIAIPAETQEISIGFDWRCVGEGTATKFDYFRVWLVPTTFVPTSGTQIAAATGRVQLGGNYNAKDTFTRELIEQNVAAYAGQDMRLVFEWRQDGSGGTQPPAAIDNLIVKVVTCSAPTNLQVTTTTSSSATISWTAATGQTTYEVYYSTTDTAPGETVTGAVTTSDNPYTITGLNPSTVYYAWVRTVCSATDKSFWRQLSFQTQQVPATLPYVEDFEGNFNWNTGTNSVNKWVAGTAVQNGGTKSMYITKDNGATNSYDVGTATVAHTYRDITIPEGATEIAVDFDWRCVGEGTTTRYDYFRVWLVPVDFVPTSGTQITATANRIKLGEEHNQQATFTRANYIQNVTVFAGQTMRLVFEWRQDGSGGDNPPAAIDNLNVAVITCSAPSAIQVNSATATSATISWTAITGQDTYEVYYSTTNTAPGETVTGSVTTTDNPYTINGLTASTTYYVWVRTVCSATDKSLWRQISFQTQQIPATLPYVEDFEGNFNWNAGTNSINKWVVGTAAQNGGTKSMYISKDNGTTNTYDVGASTVAHAYRDIQVDQGILEVAVQFDWRCVGEGTSTRYDYFKVWLVPATFVPTSGTQITEATNRILLGSEHNNNPEFIRQEYIQEVTVFAGQTMRLVFEWRQDSSGGTQPPAAIDNLNVSVVTCSAPRTIQLDHITDTSATVSWPVVAGQDTYEIYYSTTNTAPGETVTGSVTTTDNPYTIDGLTPNTRYYLWIRTVCSANDKSLWKDLSFITGQIPAVLPFDEKFEEEDNWTKESNTINRWVIGRAISNGGSKSLYISKDEGLTNTYDISLTTAAHAYRDIAVPERISDCEFSFDWRCMGHESFGTQYDYFKVWLVPTSFSPIAGEQISVGANRVQIGGIYNGEEEDFVELETVINLSDYAGGSVRLVFEWIQNSFGGTQPPAAIDNIKITPITCPGVVNLESEVMEGAPSRVLLTWEAQGDEAQWEVYIVPIENETLPTDNTTGIIVDTNSHVFVNPNPAGDDQFYRFYVRPICSDTDKGRWSEVGIISFIPPPGCANVNAEIEFSEIEGLEKNEKGEYVICEKGTFNFELGASYYDILKTNSYEVSSIEYKPPFPFKGGGAVELTSDDVWSDVIDLGFDFCFYGNKYDKVLINTNGTISFSIQGVVPGGRYRPGATSAPYNPTSLIPSDPGVNNPATTSGPTINSIMGVFQDTHPGEDKAPADHSINYQIIGKAPCRTLVFNVYRLGMYGTGCTYDPNDVDNTTQTSQIVIYEGTNIIEVYVKNRHSLCDAWEGKAIIGIQNADGTAGIAPPGRNTGRWSAQNEAWRFTPNGESTAEFSWEKDGEFFSSEAKIDIAVTETVTYTAKAKYEICGAETVLFKEFKFVKEDFTMGVPNDLIDCSRPTGEINFVDLSNNDSVVLGSLDPEKYIVEYFESEENMNANTGMLDPIYNFTTNKTLYVRLTNKRTGCSTSKTFKAIIQPPLNVTKSADQSVCGAYVFPELPDGEAYYTQEYGQGDRYDGGESYDELGMRTFYIYREDEKGCYGQTSFVLEVVEQPIADDIADQIMYCDIYFLPEPSKYNKYFTQPGGKGEELKAGSPIIKPQTIYVYAYNKGLRGAECIDEKSFTISYEDCPIPKGISPNGDGLNDTFDLSQHGISKIQIFNRNGVEVYSHGLGYKKEWFGQNNSDKLLPVGTYYYVVVSNGKVRTGWVQLNY
ncbi:fibronectin type III domain-containing protein [Myroides sp. WP-1]|uniref:fibronectin type III domain-containing protein n=1 Tax=Myroides sp. WP-1 TaxID=2759944 RepID=UPI0015F8CF19|nr:fibronectin type III domain-containing protein [Myroides sp. WP-1]MBB1140961.1 fibronectin type III domain-containing protein [Myroides sp. WP-1]